MFLQQLEVENLRSIPHASISFEDGAQASRKWTLIMGENGCGKSSLLRALALVTAGSQALPALLPDPASLVRNGAAMARLKARLATKAGEERNIELLIGRDDTISDVLLRNVEGLRELDLALRRAARSYFVAGYGASRRLAEVERSRSLGKSRTPIRAQAVLSLFDRDASLEPLDAWIMQQDYATDGAGLADVREALDGLLPDVTFSRIDKAAGRVLFSTADGEVPLSELSDGYQNVAAWCGDLLAHISRAFDDRRRPREARGLLLLDEIDLHLHPRWQRALLAYIDRQFPNLQIVATTHSPFTAQQAKPGELHVMRRSAEGTIDLRPFRGDPRRLRIEDLVDPLLGIATTESTWFEAQRAELNEARSAENAPRVSELEAVLGEASRARLNAQEREQVALLDTLRQTLTQIQERPR
jgi:energy-coupling factor transporter ATP-binding protein EcfA2